jgi:hypothetical protein
MQLTPVDRDTYMFRMMIVRFRRDAGGRVVGFDYGNPLARGVGFTRLGDRRGEGGRLHGRPAGGAMLPLSHVSGTTFSAADRPITLTFTVDAGGRATGLVMRQNGNERTLPRVR